MCVRAFAFIILKDTHMTSLSYGRIFCLESQKIDGTYQRHNHYFDFFYLNFPLF